MHSKQDVKQDLKNIMANIITGFQMYLGQQIRARLGLFTTAYCCMAAMMYCITVYVICNVLLLNDLNHPERLGASLCST